MRDWYELYNSRLEKPTSLKHNDVKIDLELGQCLQKKKRGQNIKPYQPQL